MSTSEQSRKRLEKFVQQAKKHHDRNVAEHKKIVDRLAEAEQKRYELDSLIKALYMQETGARERILKSAKALLEREAALLERSEVTKQPKERGPYKHKKTVDNDTVNELLKRAWT